MKAFEHKVYVEKFSPEGHFILTGDIGGTNSNFGLFLVNAHTVQLLASFHTKSQEITTFPPVVREVVNLIKQHYGIIITRACFGAAGVITDRGHATKPTNLNFMINVDDVKQAAGLKELCLMNDFQAVGYGIDLIDPNDLIVINKGTPVSYENKACLGAGTGLGKTILTYCGSSSTYDPMASEGGHADCSMQTQEEFDALTYIKDKEINGCNVSWEDVLSGFGIQRIYRFLGTTGQYQLTDFDREIEASQFPPDAISKYRHKSPRCEATFCLYVKLYARCAKNLALDALARNGVYIAGGIASKNIDMFKLSFFMDEFVNCGKQEALLTAIPVYIIGDYNVSLFGAAAHFLQSTR